MITHETSWRYPMSYSRRLPGTSHAWITRAVFDRPEQANTQLVVTASGDVRGSRLPTHAESGNPNVAITQIQLKTVKSGAPPSVPPSLRSLCFFAAIPSFFLIEEARSSLATPASLQAQPAHKISHTRFETDPRVGG
jgi:hypothetical protein